MIVDNVCANLLGTSMNGTAGILSDRPVRIVGEVSFGLDPGDQPAVLAGDATFDELVEHRGSIPQVDLGLVIVDPSADPEAVAANLRAALPDGVHVLLKQSLIDLERNYQCRKTPSAAVLRWSVVPCVFLLVAVYCWYLSWTLPGYKREFAMLQTLGYPVAYFVQVLIAELSWLTGVGAVAALPVAGVMRWAINRATAVSPGVQSGNWRLVVASAFGVCLVIGLWNGRGMRNLRLGTFQ